MKSLTFGKKPRADPGFLIGGKTIYDVEGGEPTNEVPALGIKLQHPIRSLVYSKPF